MVTIVKKRLGLNASLYTLLQVLLVTLFEKIPLNKGFLVSKHTTEEHMNPSHLKSFEN